MKTGSLGTFVISWSQTEVDGLKAAPLDVLAVGTTWRWTGAVVRVDGPQGVLLLEGADGTTDIRKRAARMVRRLVGAAVGGDVSAGDTDQADGLPEQGFIVTDGHQSFTVTLIPVPDTGARLLMLVGDLPPVDQDLWVVRTSIDRRSYSVANDLSAKTGSIADALRNIPSVEVDVQGNVTSNGGSAITAAVVNAIASEVE